MKKGLLLITGMLALTTAVSSARTPRGMDLITCIIKQGVTDPTPEQQKRFTTLVQEIKGKDPKQLDIMYAHLGEKMTPLMFAAYYAQPSYVKVLLDAGADAFITSKGPLKLKASNFVFMVLPHEKEALATELHIIKHPGSKFDPREKNTITTDDRERLKKTAELLINHEAKPKKPRTEKRRV